MGSWAQRVNEYGQTQKPNTARKKYEEFTSNRPCLSELYDIGRSKRYTALGGPAGFENSFSFTKPVVFWVPFFWSIAIYGCGLKTKSLVFLGMVTLVIYPLLLISFKAVIVLTHGHILSKGAIVPWMLPGWPQATPPFCRDLELSDGKHGKRLEIDGNGLRGIDVD